MKGKIFILIMLVQGVLGSAVFAQITGPEQDCFGAIPVCQTVFVQNQSYQGIGDIEDISNANSCLGNGENNSVWYVFTITVSGVLEFSIVPQAGDDYDFALYNITGASCADIFNGGLEVRCNYAFSNNATGLMTGFSNSTVGPGGAAFLAPLTVSAGETYALLVDNFSSTAGGYAIDFAPSANTTASILDVIPPVLDSIAPIACNNTSFITVVFSESITCSSLHQDGSNFSLSGDSAVTVTGINCQSGSFARAVQLELSTPITVAGTYTLIFNSSINGLTLEDGCGNAALPSIDTFTFYAAPSIAAGFTFDCVGDSILFMNTSVGDSIVFLWTFGDGTSTTAVSPVHVYAYSDAYPVSMTASNSGCAVTLTETVTVLDNFLVNFIYPPNAAQPGQPILFYNYSHFSNSVNYFWDFGDGNISTIRHPSHTYSAIGTYPVCLRATEGCYSDTICKNVDVDTVSGITSPLNFFIELFPNPVSDVVEVRIENNAREIVYTLFSSVGMKLFTATTISTEFSFDFTKFPAGVYFLKIESGKSFAVKEIIKL